MAIKRSTIRFAGLFLVLLGSVAFADDWLPQPIGPFGTLNTRDNSFAIPATNSQDLLNVDITIGGKSVKKRKGFASAFSLPVSTSPVHGIYNFFDSNGNDVSLFFNDKYVTTSVGGGSLATITSTASYNATNQCTDNLGFAYCADSNRTRVLKTNGVVFSNLPVTSTGTMLAVCPTRLAQAGFAEAPSRIDFSSDGDFTTWTIGSLGTSGTQFTISAPGAKITHITYAFGRLMWFKDTSFGYILIGNQPLQTDWVIKTIAYDVGTNDNTSVYREGILYFRGNDSHIYAFDGSNYQRLSREISSTINLSQTRTAGAWVQTSQADFNGGTVTSGLSTAYTPGSIVFDSTTVIDDYSSATWGGVSTTTSNGGKFSRGPAGFNLTYSATLDSSQAQGYYNAPASSGVWLFSVDATGNGNFSWFVKLTTGAPADADPLHTNGYLLAISSIAIRLDSISGSSRVLISSISHSASASAQAYTFSRDASGNFRVTCPEDSITITGNSLTFTSLPYFVVYATGNPSGSGGSFDSLIFGYLYGTFQSAVKNAPSLTTWDSFQATKQDNGGSNSFYIRSSSVSFTVTAQSPAWTAISPGAIPSISTGPYFQIRDDFSRSASSYTPQLDDFTQNWFEGSASDKAYATYFDDKIWWSVTYGTAATTNNRDLVYDLLNQGWLIYDIPISGFLTRQNHLYFGSPLAGSVYKYGDVNNDNGVAINSYWKSKDFFGNNPFTTQEIANISVVAKQVNSSSMTVTYTLNGSSSTSYQMNLSNPNVSFVNKNRVITAGTVASDFNIQFGNNAIDQTFEVFAVQVGVRPRSWTSTP